MAKEACKMVTIEEIKFKGLGLLGSTSLGRKAGQFIFFGSQTPVDLKTGKLTKSLRDVPADIKGRLTIGTILNDAPDDRIHAQAWRLFSNLAEILKQQGGALDDIVHQRIFLKEMRDVPAVERVLRLLMPNGFPSTAVVGATSEGVDPDIHIQADFIVLAPGSGIRKQNVSIPELDHLAAPYPLATRAGQYLFTTPLAGVNLETGKLTTRISELTDDERKFLEPPYSSGRRSRSFRPTAQRITANRSTCRNIR
jgi:enamine deaminase RidA (YjgF/YER057c/UK114 family)